MPTVTEKMQQMAARYITKTKTIKTVQNKGFCRSIKPVEPLNFANNQKKYNLIRLIVLSILKRLKKLKVKSC